VDISQVKPRPRKYTDDAPKVKEPAALNGNGLKNGNGHGSGRTVPSVVPGEDTVNGGNGVNDPLSTAPAGGYPRDGGSGTEMSKTAPNMADIEPGKGGAN
jgi:hypothetical protein